MTIREFIAGELIDVVEWIDDTTDTMLWRFARPKNEIKNGAQLIVRPGQVAVFVDRGDIADVFQPGMYQLTTKNLPLLSTMRGWKYGFESPFKAEVLFVSTRHFMNQKWGTKNPVMMRDPRLGPVRLRAYGTFAVRVRDAVDFVRELGGTNLVYTIDQIDDQLRDMLVARFSDLLAERQVPVFELAAQYGELASAVADRLAADTRRYGLDVTSLVIENISLPPEVEGAVDERTRMGVLGDLGAYAQLQSADAMRDAARNPSGVAAGGVGLGLGLAMGQQAGALAPRAPVAPQQPPAPPSPSEPPPIPSANPVYLVVNGERVGPLDPAALREQARSGALRPDTLVWRAGMAQWTPARDVPDVALLLVPTA
ncbi:MAG TPA: SPFH domain-containing protein [Gemmatimonadaceae bacterium]